MHEVTKIWMRLDFTRNYSNSPMNQQTRLANSLDLRASTMSENREAYPIIIGNSLSSLLIGSSARPNASSVKAPRSTESPSSPKITSATPTLLPYLNNAQPFLRLILVPSASLNSCSVSGLNPNFSKRGAGTTEYIAPESIRKSIRSVTSGLSGFPISIFKTVSPVSDLSGYSDSSGAI